MFDDLHVAVDVPDGDARGEGGDDLDGPAGEAQHAARGPGLVGLLGVDGAGRGHLQDRGGLLRRRAVDDVGQVVDDRHERQAEPATELQQALEELGDEGRVDDVPGFLDEEDALLAVRSDPGVLEPHAHDGHEDGHGDGVAVDVGEVEDDQRGVEVDADRRRSVEHAAQVAVDQAVQHQGDVQAPGPYVVYVDVHRLRGLGLGVAELLDDVGEDGLPVEDGLVDVGVGDLEREAGPFVEPAARRDLDDRTEEGELAGRRDGGVERVEADAAVEGGHGVEPDGGYAQLLRDQVPLADAVLALGVQHDDLPVAEAQLPQDVGLLERGLAVAGLAEDEPVGGGQLLAVELEGVVDVALAGVDLAADDHAGVAEAGCRGGQVDGLRLAGGGADGQAGGFDLPEEETGERFGDGGERVEHGIAPIVGCRSRTAAC